MLIVSFIMGTLTRQRDPLGGLFWSILGCKVLFKILRQVYWYTGIASRHT